MLIRRCRFGELRACFVSQQFHQQIGSAFDLFFVFSFITEEKHSHWVSRQISPCVWYLDPFRLKDQPIGFITNSQFGLWYIWMRDSSHILPFGLVALCSTNALLALKKSGGKWILWQQFSTVLCLCITLYHCNEASYCYSQHNWTQLVFPPCLRVRG